MPLDYPNEDTGQECAYIEFFFFLNKLSQLQHNCIFKDMG